MKKFPFQFTVDVTSLVGVCLFVVWTSHGGLRKEILHLFGSDTSSNDLNDQVGHISGLLYYYALIATTLTISYSLLKLIPGKLFLKIQQLLPTLQHLQQTLLDLIHYLIIFTGVYVYLIQKKGVGLKNNQLVLFPFWFLITVVLQIVGQILSAVLPKHLILTSAATYLNVITLGLMLAQIFGYKPFSYF